MARAPASCSKLPAGCTKSPPPTNSRAQPIAASNYVRRDPRDAESLALLSAGLLPLAAQVRHSQCHRSSRLPLLHQENLVHWRSRRMGLHCARSRRQLLYIAHGQNVQVVDITPELSSPRFLASAKLMRLRSMIRAITATSATARRAMSWSLIGTPSKSIRHFHLLLSPFRRV